MTDSLVGSFLFYLLYRVGGSGASFPGFVCVTDLPKGEKGIVLPARMCLGSRWFSGVWTCLLLTLSPIAAFVSGLL